MLCVQSPSKTGSLPAPGGQEATKAYRQWKGYRPPGREA